MPPSNSNSGFLHSESAVNAAVAAIRAISAIQPECALVLGTGLGGLAREIDVEAVIDYGSIPGFPLSTVESHAGRLLLGTLAGRRVAAMQGRFHRYEGYSLREVTFPLRVLRALGAETLVVSNACGGMNPLWQAGDLMLISDHINFLGDNPLIGPHEPFHGPRFPDMSDPYTTALRVIAREEALAHGITLREGIYIAVTGPCLETRAEYRALRMLGADVVGMSTVPEVIVAVQCGMRVLGVSIITDMCLPDALEPVTLEKVIGVASASEPRLTKLVKGVLARI
jgi:purine-nucleoside phosphorylase